MSDTETNPNDILDSTSISRKIIREVQKRPALYDARLRRRCDKTKKAELWTEVYSSIYKNWHKLSKYAKQKNSNLIQRKWKNMRDSFAKELAMIQSSSEPGAIKKKKYIHFDSMLFLVPCLQRREGGMIQQLQIASENDDHRDKLDFPQVDSEPTTSQTSFQSQSDNEGFRQRIIEILGSKPNTSVYDEDINFSQMIVPMLRKLNDEQKHFAKMEIMTILQKAKSYKE